MKTPVCFFCAIFLFAANCFGDVVHDESIDGDLSNDNFAPTIVMIAMGSNEILGSTTPDPLDRDFWTVTVAPGLQLDAVVLQLYDTIEFQSWFAVEAGTQVTSLTDPSSLLGGALIGGEPGAQQGDDVLDDLGNAIFGGTGFTGPLGPGTYTFWFQETGSNVNYELNFVVSAGIPEPSSMLLLIGFVATLGVSRRRT